MNFVKKTNLQKDFIITPITTCKKRSLKITITKYWCKTLLESAKVIPNLVIVIHFIITLKIVIKKKPQI
jgi:hypothetical protein